LSNLRSERATFGLRPHWPHRKAAADHRRRAPGAVDKLVCRWRENRHRSHQPARRPHILETSLAARRYGARYSPACPRCLREGRLLSEAARRQSLRRRCEVPGSSCPLAHSSKIRRPARLSFLPFRVCFVAPGFHVLVSRSPLPASLASRSLVAQPLLAVLFFCRSGKFTSPSFPFTHVPATLIYPALVGAR